jgi:hypothetical protein
MYRAFKTFCGQAGHGFLFFYFQRYNLTLIVTLL